MVWEFGDFDEKSHESRYPLLDIRLNVSYRVIHIKHAPLPLIPLGFQMDSIRIILRFLRFQWDSKVSTEIFFIYHFLTIHNITGP